MWPVTLLDDYLYYAFDISPSVECFKAEYAKKLLKRGVTEVPLQAFPVALFV